MINMEVSATYGESKPLEELSRLMALRCKVLYETAKDAAIATIINAATSIRAVTRRSKPSAKTKPKIVLRSELKPSWHKYSRSAKGRFVFRNELGHRIAAPMKTVHVYPRGTQFGVLHTYLVTPEHKRDRQYLAVAQNIAQVKRYEDRRATRRKIALGGLAQYTLGLAMAKLSTRNGPDDAGVRAQTIAPQFAFASSALHGNELTLELRDTLDYALAALKGGPTSIDFALRKAANKTFGLLSQECKKWGKIEDIGPCPFPELVGKRRAS